MRKRQYGHREFLKWLRAERKSFLNPPVITKSGYNKTEFLLKGVNRAVRGFYVQKSRDYSEITVWVKWDNECVDLIFDFDLKEKRTVDGYCCSLCLPESIVNYPERKELFVKHSFETFLEWCNGTLSHSNWLEIFYEKDHSSGVRLVKEKVITEDERFYFAPLHFIKKNECREAVLCQC